MKLVQQYHPDKHMNSSHDERQRAEQYFKMVRRRFTFPYLPCSPKIFKNKVPKNHAKISARNPAPKIITLFLTL
jgi:hypothetical protein